MRFYTKEWRILMLNCGLSSTVKKIPNGHYTDEKIKNLYDKQLEEQGKFGIFPQCYERNLVACESILPQWLLDEVDHRLIALEYLPEKAYDKFLAESKEYRLQWDAINQAAEEYMKKEKIPEKVAASMRFSQASILSLKNKNADIELIISKDSLEDDGDENPYRKIIFKNAKILEKEEGIDDISSNLVMLDNEIHTSANGFIFYMTIDTPKGLAYLTVECQDVHFENYNMP